MREEVERVLGTRWKTMETRETERILVENKWELLLGVAAGSSTCVNGADNGRLYIT